MSIEEQQQIEITRVPQAPDTVEEIPDSRGRHPLWRPAEGVSMHAPSREGNRARPSRRSGNIRDSVP
jgi:hypothetical protein